MHHSQAATIEDIGLEALHPIFGGNCMTRVRLVVVISVLSFAAPTLLADVRADEKTHTEFAGMLGRMVNLFGGKAAREGVTSTVAVKGDRKATLNDTTGQIID